MPISKYFGGHGEKVMKNMTKEYGAKKGKRVFYAMSNKRKSKSKNKGNSARDQAAALRNPNQD